MNMDQQEVFINIINDSYCEFEFQFNKICKYINHSNFIYIQYFKFKYEKRIKKPNLSNETFILIISI